MVPIASTLSKRKVGCEIQIQTSADEEIMKEVIWRQRSPELRLSAAVCGRVAAFWALGQIFGLLGSGGCQLEITRNSPVKNLELGLPRFRVGFLGCVLFGGGEGLAGFRMGLVRIRAGFPSPPCPRAL